jgi:hypothetical protein
MSYEQTAPCPHGPRPGTTFCVHCRNDARIAARKRRYRLGARIGVFTLGGATLAALIIGALTAIAPDAKSRGNVPTITVIETPSRGDASKKAPAGVKSPATVQPSIAVGRKHLGDSIYAERSGDEVTVNFDTDALRTRFDWKFEGVVRATLPMVYGDAARIALDSIPSGKLVRGRLLEDLPGRGIPVSFGADRSLRIFPVVRPGRDGPLVVAYRVTNGR